MSLFPGNTEYIFIVLKIDGGGGGGKYTREIEFYLHIFYATFLYETRKSARGGGLL